MNSTLLAYSTGAIDLQINGCLGLSFNNLSSADTDRLGDVCRFLYDQGVDGFLPTLVTTDIDALHRSLSVLQKVMTKDRDSRSAAILGVHLEGPFLHPDRRGAHPEQFLLELTPANVRRVVGDFASIIRLMTIAPELDQSGESIGLLQSWGIKLSIGHTICNLEQAYQAQERGINLITHLFNAMPGLHHREPGLIGLALKGDFYCGLIADGHHLHPVVVDLVFRLLSDRLFLVSDALPPLGLPEAEYPWDDRKITVKDGVCRLPDGTLAGTTLGIWSGVLNLVKWQVCPLSKAIELVTTNPCRALGITPPLAAPLVWYQTETGTIDWVRLKSSTALLAP